MDGKILIVYYHDLGYPMRATNRDMLFCFGKYSDHLCFYLNVAFGVPEYLKDIDFDIVIYHDLLICKRSLPKRFRDFMERSGSLKKLKGLKVATVQDEFMQIGLLNKFINDFGVRHIFSAAMPEEWKMIYPDVDRSAVKFTTVLTGCLDKETVNKINKLAEENNSRPLDIGYRATPLRPSLGEHGYMKYKIAEIFKENVSRFNLKVDISNDPKDTFLGDDWYRFLLSSKYTIGVESGASVLDAEGEVGRSVEKFVEKNPEAGFREVQEACFKDLDGKFRYFALGPRHLEACATKTCQILIEGRYNGVLEAGKHYIELKKDFSNLDEVLKIVKEDRVRERIVNQAYNDIVISGKYTYERFVNQLLKSGLGPEHKWSHITERENHLYKKNRNREKLIWKYIPIRSFIILSILNHIPKSWFKKIVRYFN